MTPLSEIQALLKEQHFDGWLFYDHHLRDPLAYRVLRFTPPRTPSRRWFYLIPAEGEPRKLAHRIEPGMLDALPGSTSLYSSWQTLHAELAGMLSGFTNVAMQHSPLCDIPYVAMVDGGMIELIRKLGLEIRSSADLVQHFEAVWTEEQLELHLSAGRRVDRIRAAAFRKIGDTLRAGNIATEYEIAQFIRDQFSAEGLFTDHGPIVAVNANASNPHYEPTAESSAPLRKGDLVLIDLWAKLNVPEAVYYDITWTGFCGPVPPDEMLRVFDVVKKARQQAVQFVKASVEHGAELRGYMVDDAARGYITAQGYGEYFFHRTGHNIGIDIHGAGANMDNLESHDTRFVIPGTCFSVEPGVYLPDFGIRSEVNVFVEGYSARVTGEEQEALLTLCD